MARIRCHYTDCIFLEDRYCSSPAIQLDPEIGCRTYRAPGEVGKDDEILIEEELLDDWDLEELEALDDDSLSWDIDDL